MSVFDAKKTSVTYYEDVREKTTVSGFKKFIAVEKGEALFIPHPGAVSGVYVFLCETRNGENLLRTCKLNAPAPAPAGAIELKKWNLNQKQ